MAEHKPNDLLWEGFKKGSRSAFEEIYRTNAPFLVDYGVKICNNVSLVEDSIQDLFIELWKSRKNLSSTTSIKFYLFKALRYKIYRALQEKKLKASEPVEEYLYRFKHASHEDVCIEMEVQSEQMKHLRDTLEKLPERQREAIILRYFHSFSNEEIANLMGVNYHSACKLLYAGLGNLKENLKTSVMSLWIYALAAFMFFMPENIFWS